MSYLNLPNGIPDFEKFVGSLWFWLPRETLEKVADAAWDENELYNESDAFDSFGIFGPDFDHEYVRPRMHGLVPLKTWGPLEDGYQIVGEDGKTLFYTEYYATNGSVTSTGGTFPYLTGQVYSKGKKKPVPPSGVYVNVYWSSDDNGHKTDELNAEVFVRVQLEGNGSGEWVYAHNTLTISNYAINSNIGPGTYTSVTVFPYDTVGCALVPDFMRRVESSDAKDITSLMLGAFGPVAVETDRFTVTPEHWHNIIFSGDFSTGKMTAKSRLTVYDSTDCPETDCKWFVDGVGNRQCLPQNHVVSDKKFNSIKNPFKFWLAIDGVNKKPVGGQFNAISNDGGQGQLSGTEGDNTLVPVYATSAKTVGRSYLLHQISAWSSYTIRDLRVGTTPGLPTWDYDESEIPSDGNPLGLPAAENLSDSVFDVVMAEYQFYTDVTLDTGKEDNIRAVIKNDEDRTPEKMSVLEKLLDKKPILKLHGSNNWVVGKNTGSLGDNDGDDIDFEPKALIRPWLPNPSLRGKQKLDDK